MSLPVDPAGAADAALPASASTPVPAAGDTPAEQVTAAQLGLLACHACQLLTRPASVTETGYCPRCGEHLESRHQPSLDTSWALLVAAAICFIPANALPVLDTTQLGTSEPDTILHGVAFLWVSGSWHLALIVLVASFMIPLGKLFALGYLLWSVRNPNEVSSRDRTRLYRLVEFIGRWSLLDVFVAAFTVALVQLQPLVSVAPGTGVLFFAAVVVLTMLSAEAFDPRLIWDSPQPRKAERG